MPPMIAIAAHTTELAMPFTIDTRSRLSHDVKEWAARTMAARNWKANRTDSAK
jgi:hypothetical protein